MSRSFNGSSDAINCGNGVSLRQTTWTVSTWINGAVLGGGTYRSICCYGEPIGKRDYNLGVNTVSQARVLFSTGASTFHGVEGATTLSTGVWYHIAGTYDGTTLLLYVNGVQDGSLSFSGTPDCTSLASLYIGELFGSAEYFNGQIAHFALWSAAFSVNQIVDLASGWIPNKVNTSNLQAYLPLFGLVSPEPDVSGNGNNGTLTGTSRGATDPNTNIYLPYPTGPIVAQRPPIIRASSW